MVQSYPCCGVVFVLVLILITGIDGISVCSQNAAPPDDFEVTSPGYGREDYRSGINCTLTITTDPGKVFKVTLHDVDIMPNDDASPPTESRKFFLCRVDKVVIDFGNEKHTRCGRLYDSKEETFNSTGNTLTVRFVTEPGEVYNRKFNRGFRLTYSIEMAKVDGESVCPGRLIKKKRSGTLFSPGFPNNYGNNQNCRVKIPIPDNFQMNVWFSEFSLQNSPTCQNDWLSVRDEHGGHRMCGGGPNRIPPLQELKASLARFHFTSDSYLTKKGFRLHYNMTRLQQAHCMCAAGNSYICMMNFNKKVRRAWHRIKFTIRTTQREALIMFSKGRLRDYIYIGIRDGKVFYRSDLGTGSSSVVANDATVNDDRWHSVEIRRRRRILSVTVDNGRAEDFDRTRGDFSKIDLPDSVGFILGTPPELKILPNFVGCIRDFTIDGREPLTNAFVSKPMYPSSGMQYMSEC